MNEPEKNYQNLIQELEKNMENNQIQHTVYLSRRTIWANVLFCFLLSPLAGYIHTRRWKPLGTFSLIFFGFLLITQPPNQSFAESFAHGQKYSLLASLISTIDNSIAIKKAQNKVKQ
jgi:hypothetical protein